MSSVCIAATYGTHKSQNFSHCKNPLGAFRWAPPHLSSSFSSPNPIDKFLANAAAATSSPPPGGSGAEYSGCINYPGKVAEICSSETVYVKGVEAVTPPLDPNNYTARVEYSGDSFTIPVFLLWDVIDFHRDTFEQLPGSRPKETTKQVAGIDQEEVEDPTLLADSDSCFCEFNGVHLHHKICDADISAPQSPTPIQRVNFPMVLLHGFGASVFSWDRVMKPLARVTGSNVLAFDRPAFGLTARVNAIKHQNSGNQDSRPLNPYSPIFSVLATLYFIEFLASQKTILVGHSAGALVALDAYFEAPERVAALILVAPAILAPFSMRNTVKDDKNGIENQTQGNSSDSNTRQNLFFGFFGVLAKLTKFFAEAIVRMAKGMTTMINSLYRKALSAILRSALGVVVIRMIIDKFGISAVRSAWYDANQVSDHVVQGYTKPLKVKGWDKALVEYTIAMLTDSASNPKKLMEVSCPVLIITGDTDRLVPSWNSKSLSRAIPGSTFEVIKKCGHLPQEEKPEEFISIVDKFLQRVFFGVAEEEPDMQAVTT